MKSIFRAWNKLSLIVQIIIGLVIGISLAVIAPKQLAFSRRLMALSAYTNVGSHTSYGMGVIDAVAA